MPAGRATSDEPCKCRRRASVVCRCWGRQVGLRPGMGFPLVASRRAASCSIRSNNCCASPTTETKASMQYVIFRMAWPKGPRLGDGPPCSDRRATRGSDRLPQEHHGGVGPWSATAEAPRHGGATRGRLTRVRRVLRDRPMRSMGPAIRHGVDGARGRRPRR
jgi:hypothetical protein